MRRLVLFVVPCLLFSLLAWPHPRSVSLGPVVMAQQPASAPAPKYDLLLRGGHVVDARNKISAVRDVAIAGGKIAAVEDKLNPADALKTVDVSGLYVTPGLVDIHAHTYTGTGERGSYAGDNSVPPDGFTFRVGVTTVADAGCAGWRNFEDFKQRIIDRSKTRILAFINIVGNGMRGGKFEQDLTDMEAKPTAEMAQRFPGLIIGVKTAHYSGPGVGAGRARRRGRHDREHPGDGGLRCEQAGASGRRARDEEAAAWRHLHARLLGIARRARPVRSREPGLIEGRKRGVIFDVGHGGGSFLWRIAVPAIKEGFLPDSISTDLHIGSMNTGMKDMLNVMDKFLAMGLSLDDVIAKSTWNPAREIKQDGLGHLSVGAVADIAVLRVEKGRFGLVDMNGARMDSTERLMCELTVKDGRVVYDLNGISRPDWTTLPASYGPIGDGRWDGLNPARGTTPGQRGRGGVPPAAAPSRR